MIQIQLPQGAVVQMTAEQLEEYEKALVAKYNGTVFVERAEAEPEPVAEPVVKIETTAEAIVAGVDTPVESIIAGVDTLVEAMTDVIEPEPVVEEEPEPVVEPEPEPIAEALTEVAEEPGTDYTAQIEFALSSDDMLKAYYKFVQHREIARVGKKIRADYETWVRTHPAMLTELYAKTFGTAAVPVEPEPVVEPVVEPVTVDPFATAAAELAGPSRDVTMEELIRLGQRKQSEPNGGPKVAALLQDLKITDFSKLSQAEINNLAARLEEIK